MITAELRAQIRRLVLLEKLPIETVARRFGVHHSTVRRALADGTQSGDDLAKARRLDRGLRDRARGWTDDGPARASTPGLV